MSKILLLAALVCLLAFSVVAASSKTTIQQRNTKQPNVAQNTNTNNLASRSLYKTQMTCSPATIRAENSARCVLQGSARDGSRFKLSSADVSLTLSHGTTGPLQFNQHDGTVSFSVRAPLVSAKLHVTEAHGAAAEILVAMKPESSNLYCEKNELKVGEDVVCHIESLHNGEKLMAMAEDFTLSNSDGLVTPLEQTQADHFTFRFMAPDALPHGKSVHNVMLSDGYSKIDLRVMSAVVGGSAAMSEVSEESSGTVSSEESSGNSEESSETGSNLPAGADDTAEGQEVTFIVDSDVLSLGAFNSGELEHTFTYHDNQHKVVVAIAEDRKSATIMVDDGSTVLESVSVTLDDMVKDAEFNTIVGSESNIEAYLTPRVLARLLALDAAVASGSSYGQIVVSSVRLRKIVDVVVDPEEVDWSGISTPEEEESGGSSGGSSEESSTGSEESSTGSEESSGGSSEESSTGSETSTPTEESSTGSETSTPTEESSTGSEESSTGSEASTPAESSTGSEESSGSEGSETSTPVAEPLSLPRRHRFGVEMTEAHLETLKNIFSTLGVSNRILAVQFKFFVLGDEKASDESQKAKGRSASQIASELATQQQDSNSAFRFGQVSQHAISYLQLVSVPVSLDHCTETKTWVQSGLCSASIRASGETPDQSTSSGSGLSTVGVVLVVVGVLVGAVLTVTGVRAYRQRRRTQAAESLAAHNSRQQKLIDGSNRLDAAGAQLGGADGQYVPPRAPVNTNDRMDVP